MSTDVYLRLRNLLPDQPLLVGTISEARVDYTALVTLPDGGILIVRNPTKLLAGARVFIQDGGIQGEAPTLDYEEGEI